MVEQLISYKTAKLAKSKGFVGKELDESIWKWYTPLETVDKRKFSSEYILAPTQSLLAKWLREVHKIHIELNWFLDDSWKYWLVSDHLGDEDDDLTYNSYEEALEKGLFEALSTIK